MTLLFCSAHLEDADASTCVTAAHEARRTNRYGAFGFGGVKAALSGEVPKTLSSHLALSVAASPLMADGLKGNPRQVKRFLNALMLRRELARVAGLENAIETNKLVKLMILEYVEPDLFVDDAGRDFRTCLSLLRRNSPSQEIANTLLASGPLDVKRLSGYASLVQRAMDEVRALLRDKGAVAVRRAAGMTA